MMHLHRVTFLLWGAFALLSPASAATNMRNPLVPINNTPSNETSSTVPGVSIVNPGLFDDDFIVLSNSTRDDDTPHEIYVSFSDPDKVPNLSPVSITVSNSTDGSPRPDILITSGNHTVVVPGWTVPDTRDTGAAARERRQLSGSEIVYSVEDSESRPCTTPDNHDGLCKDLSDCPDLILNLTNLRRSVCFKGLFTPGVCCSKSALRTTDEETTTRRSFLTQAFTTPRPPLAQPPQPRPPLTSTNSAQGRPPVLPAVHPNARYRCGVSRIPEQRVVGGEESSKGKWPWMAAIFLHGPKKTEFWCGASLVSASYVLTAAHCTRDPNGRTFNPQQFTVRVGDHNIFSSQDDYLVDPRTFRVEEIRPHPDFKARGFYNDVALLKLTEPVNFSDYIVPICLPPPDMVARPLDHLVGQAVTVVGYGSIHYDGQESAVPRDATLPIWRNSDCDAAYLQPINDIFLCAGFQDGGKDACQGDSGGPLLLYGPSQQWMQVGIVSFGNRCAEPGYPGVYTRITAFMPWIHENMLV